MRGLLLVGGGILIGVGLSYGDATLRAEKKAREEYDEALKAHMEAIRKVRDRPVSKETPAAEETDLDGPDMSDDAITVGGEMTFEVNASDAANPYWVAPEVQEAANEYAAPGNFVDGVVALQYIDEDEYHDEDGREKEQVLVHRSEDGEPLFLSDGIVMGDWKTVLGPNILVAFYQKFPPGSSETQVLYVRNNVNDVDYEVLMESP